MAITTRSSIRVKPRRARSQDISTPTTAAQKTSSREQRSRANGKRKFERAGCKCGAGARGYRSRLGGGPLNRANDHENGPLLRPALALRTAQLAGKLVASLGSPRRTSTGKPRPSRDPRYRPRPRVDRDALTAFSIRSARPNRKPAPRRSGPTGTAAATCVPEALVICFREMTSRSWFGPDDCGDRPERDVRPNSAPRGRNRNRPCPIPTWNP